MFSAPPGTTCTESRTCTSGTTRAVTVERKKFGRATRAVTVKRKIRKTSKDAMLNQCGAQYHRDERTMIDVSVAVSNSKISPTQSTFASVSFIQKMTRNNCISLFFLLVDGVPMPFSSQRMKSFSSAACRTVWNSKLLSRSPCFVTLFISNTSLSVVGQDRGSLAGIYPLQKADVRRSDSELCERISQ